MRLTCLFAICGILYGQPTVDSRGWVIPYASPTAKQTAILRLIGGYEALPAVPVIPNGQSPWPWVDITEFGCNTSPTCTPGFNGVMTSIFTTANAAPPTLGAALAGTCLWGDAPANCAGTGSNYGVEATVGTCVIVAWNPPGQAAGSGRYYDTINFQSGQSIGFTTFVVGIPAAGNTSLTLYKCPGNNFDFVGAWTAQGNISNSWNYYDPATELYRANWRTAAQDVCGTYCTQFGTFMDTWWQWSGDNGRTTGSPRATSLLSILVRALDAHPEWMNTLFPNFRIGMLDTNSQATTDCNAPGNDVAGVPLISRICDTRELGYIQAMLVELAIADTPATGGVADFAGTVNTSGTAVTWVSGDHFDSTEMTPGPSGYAGQLATRTMLINGAYYDISTYNSTTSVTLKTSAGTQTGVAYNLGHHTWYCGAIMKNTPGWVSIVEPEGFRDLPVFRWNQGFPYQGVSNSVWQSQVYIRSLQMTYDILKDPSQSTGCPNNTLAAQLLPIITNAIDWSYNSGFSKVALGGNGYPYYDANSLTFGLPDNNGVADNTGAISHNGSIAVTNGSASVVGTSTAFTTPGHGILGSSNCNGTDWLVSLDPTVSFNHKSIYLIDSCADGTHLTLHVPFGTYGETGNLTSLNSGFYVTPSAATNCATTGTTCNSYSPPPSSIYPPPLTDPNNVLDFAGNVGWMLQNCTPQLTCYSVYKARGEEIFARATRGPRDGPYGTLACQGPGGLCYGGPGPTCDGVGGGGGAGYCQSQFASALETACGYSCGNGPSSALGKAAGQASGFTRPFSYLAYRLIPTPSGAILTRVSGKARTSGKVRVK